MFRKCLFLNYTQIFYKHTIKTQQNLRRNVCNYFYCTKQIKNLINNNININKNNINRPLICGTIAFSLLGLLGNSEKELDPEEEMVMNMKRAILCTQRSEYNKAEQLLHIALGMAQKQNNQKAITYIYDLMANLAMERDEPMKAKDLFVNVLQRLFQDGINEDDLKVLHISLKVANIHARLGYMDEAEVGYKWCLEHLAKKTDDDSLLLRGITFDYYAQLLSHNKKFTEAVQYMKNAYDICTKVMGDNNEQSIKLLNDLASTCWRAGDLDSAEQYFRQSLTKAKDQPTYVGVLKSNLGVLLLHKGLLQQAEQFCKEAWHIGRESKDDAILSQANYCLDEIKKKKT